MLLRNEIPADYRAVEHLVREAFWNRYRPGCYEHYILHLLRSEPCFLPKLDTVMEENGAVVAQIVYALGRVQKANGTVVPAPMLGPVCVHPTLQRKGYGSKLIAVTLEQAQTMGLPLVVLCGDPDFYARFGFESASKHGIFYEGTSPAEESPFFMVKILDADAAKAIRGTYSDPACFSVDKTALAAYDATFPPKEKEKRPGQLDEG